jgi:hypothetical protein
VRQVQINTQPQADKEAEGYEEYSEPLIWASSLRMIKVINETSAIAWLDMQPTVVSS